MDEGWRTVGNEVGKRRRIEVRTLASNLSEVESMGRAPCDLDFKSPLAPMWGANYRNLR